MEKIYAVLAIACSSILCCTPPNFGEDEKSDTSDTLNIALEDSTVGMLPIAGKDSFYVDSVSRESTYLILDLKYPGGCGRHTFKAFISGMPDYVTTPPFLDLWVYHDSDGDTCRKEVHTRLRIDTEKAKRIVIARVFIAPHQFNTQERIVGVEF